MMKRSIPVFQVLLILASIWGLSFFASPSAHANSSSGVSPLPNCAVTFVHLNGENPATTECKVPGKKVKGKIIPYTATEDCSTWVGVGAEMDSTTMGNLCFGGSGYTGINPNFLNAYRLLGWWNGGWVLYYKGGPGTTFYFSSSTTYTSPVFDGTTDITQICLQC